MFIATLIAGVYGTSPPAPPVPPSPQCQRLINFLHQYRAELKIFDATDEQSMVDTFNTQLHVDLNDPAQVQKFVCKFAKVKTFRQLYDLTNMQVVKPYDDAVAFYKSLVRQVIAAGGSANLVGTVDANADLQSFVQEHNSSAATVKETVDLDTLTQFLKDMQVRYGSRFLQLVFYMSNFTFEMNSPEDFATKLYESETAAELASVTTLTERHASWVLQVLLGQGRPYNQKRYNRHRLIALMLQEAGRLGYLNLQT